MIGVLGILLSLALLMYLAYRGINVLVLAPLLSLLAVVAGGDTGSATGGLSLALGMLGKTYAEAGAAAGINPELLHRVATIASGGLDSLPHNGAVITILGICR